MAVRGMGIDNGHSQCPRSLLLDAPSEGEGIRGNSGDFDQIGCTWLRNTTESSIFEPVMIRPVTCSRMFRKRASSLRKVAYGGRDRLYRVTPLSVNLQLPVDTLFLEERGQRLGRLCAAENPECDLSICHLEEMLGGFTS